MSEANPPGPDPDKLAKELKASLARRRLTTWKPVLAVLGLCTLALVLLAFWLKPRPPRPLLPLVALDAVYAPGETPLARIQLFTPADDSEPSSLSGQDVLFQGPEFVHEGRRSNMVRRRTDATGQATAELPPTPAPAAVDFLARHIDDSHGLRGVAPDSGQVFVWPKDARLLIVDLDETLLAEKLDAKAAAALKQAADADWRIVYLAAAGAQAVDYRQARDWRGEQGDLPIGPVLGRPYYPGQESAEQARRAVLRSLIDRFTGAKVAVAKSAETAAICKELGLRTIVIGDAKTPADVVHVPTWSDVFDQLK